MADAVDGTRVQSLDLDFKSFIRKQSKLTRNSIFEIGCKFVLSLDGVNGIILGKFVGLGSEEDLGVLASELSARASLPVWTTSLIGHTSPNYPMPLGAPCLIENNQLTWQFTLNRKSEHGTL